jgi:hypothetical protein
MLLGCKRVVQHCILFTNGPYVLELLGPGRLADVCETTEPRPVEIAGFLCVESEGDHKISDVGDVPIDMIESELGT